MTAVLARLRADDGAVRPYRAAREGLDVQTYPLLMVVPIGIVTPENPSFSE
jgi:hypothetical protein